MYCPYIHIGGCCVYRVCLHVITAICFGTWQIQLYNYSANTLLALRVGTLSTCTGALVHVLHAQIATCTVMVVVVVVVVVVVYI